MVCLFIIFKHILALFYLLKELYQNLVYCVILFCVKYCIFLSYQTSGMMTVCFNFWIARSVRKALSFDGSGYVIILQNHRLVQNHQIERDNLNIGKSQKRINSLRLFHSRYFFPAGL